MLTGMQSGYTQYNCFLCQWRSREKDQYSIINWPLRTSRKNGEFNIANPTLIDPKKILLPPLHLKLGIFKNFVKSLGCCPSLDRLHHLFPRLTESKIKAGVFNGPDIEKIFQGLRIAKSSFLSAERGVVGVLSLIHI